MNNLIGREKGIECTIRWNIDKNYSSSLSTVFIFKFQKNQNRKIPRFKTQFPPDCPFNRLIQSNRPIVSTSTLDRLDSPSLVCLSICHLSLIYSRFEKTQKFVINSTPRHRSTLYINTHIHIYIENVHNGDVGSIVPAHPHRAPLCRPWPAVQTGDLSKSADYQFVRNARLPLPSLHRHLSPKFNEYSSRSDRSTVLRFVIRRGLKNSRYRKSILCLFLSPPFFRYTVSRVWFQVLSVYKWVYIIQPRGMIEGCAIYGEDWIRGI